MAIHYMESTSPGRAAKDFLRRNTGWFVVLGILLVVAGILALGFTITATIFSVAIVGVILASVGIVQIVEGIGTRHWKGFFTHLGAGLLYLATGIIMFTHPALSAVTVTAFLSVFYVIMGMFRAISALILRFERWGWAFFSGLVSIAIGLMIWTSWPFSGLWIIGFFVGIDLLFYGISVLSFAASVRQLRSRNSLDL